MFKKTLLLISLSSTVMFSGMANATAPNQANMHVKLTVEAACTINIGDMDFGQSFSNADHADATAKGKVTCTNGTAYSVSATSQSGFVMSGVSSTSSNLSSSDKVAYTLYSDPNHTNSLNTSGAKTESRTGIGTAQDLTIYGQVSGSALQTAKAGDYTDVVALVVNY